MKLCVVKTGAEMFDALHAYGLGILIASASQSPVKLSDEGVSYKVYAPVDRIDQTKEDILDDVLALPSLAHLKDTEREVAEDSVKIANLDGLLALLFTTPGIRAVSTADLRHKERFRPGSADAALKKVRGAMRRWGQYTKREIHHSQRWIQNVLQDYATSDPLMLTIGRKRGKDLTILMTVDPSFSFSLCRPFSDGRIAHKDNVTLRKGRFAVLLTFIGAARFLRAQRVGSNRVNFYVPLPDILKLYPDTTLPLLSTTGYPSSQALALQWLLYQDTARALKTEWRGLAYQVMQTQGAQQSISRDRGCFDSRWLTQLERSAGKSLIGFWKWLLGNQLDQMPFEIDNLIDSLMRCDIDAWMAHLVEASRRLHSGAWEKPRPYRLQEVKEVTFAMADSRNAPLSNVLEQEGGTLRFGHALRLLGQQNPAPLRDIIDALDSVRTGDQLVRILAQAAQECAVASAKSQFIIIPTDDDLKQLLDDIDRHTARTVAGLLIILSALRYPRCVGDEDSEYQDVIGRRM